MFKESKNIPGKSCYLLFQNVCLSFKQFYMR
jgi:hypothetical protein